LIYFPNWIIAKNQHSLSDALGKITEVLETGRDYNIVMFDGTPLLRHVSNMVSSSATKSESDVTLIDSFQLIDWKDRTLSDHLYPKFKLFLEQLRKRQPVNIPEMTYQHSDNITHKETSAPDIKTGD